eukprot:2132309-Prorocentrum_lima.AAC.1
MVVEEAVKHGLSTADCLKYVPSHTPQFLGPLVDVAVDQLVHELDLVHERDPGHHAVLNVLDE